MKTMSVVTLFTVAFTCSLGFGQTYYNCRAKNGFPYVSEKPCSSPSVAIVYNGPIVERQSSIYIPKMGEAPEHLMYLSSRCSSLSEDIRTDPARGVKYDVTAGLQSEYQRECEQEDSDARS
ncbi:MAG TPA: hypothetical protein VIM63_17080 [Rhodoferax sp.]